MGVWSLRSSRQIFKTHPGGCDIKAGGCASVSNPIIVRPDEAAMGVTGYAFTGYPLRIIRHWLATNLSYKVPARHVIPLVLTVCVIFEIKASRDLPSRGSRFWISRVPTKIEKGNLDRFGFKRRAIRGFQRSMLHDRISIISILRELMWLLQQGRIRQQALHFRNF